MRYTSILGLGVVLALAACAGKNAPVSMSDTQLRGEVLDDSGQPLPGAEVSVLGTDLVTWSDAAGKFELQSSLLVGDRVVRFGKFRFAETHVRRKVDGGAQQWISAQLKRRPPVQVVTLPAEGDKITVKSGNLELTIPSGALCKLDTTVLTGQANVTLLEYDARNPRVMPASAMLQTGELIRNKGMVSYFITENPGNACVQICPGKQLTLVRSFTAEVQIDPAKYMHTNVNLVTGKLEVVAAVYDATARTATSKITRLFPYRAPRAAPGGFAGGSGGGSGDGGGSGGGDGAGSFDPGFVDSAPVNPTPPPTHTCAGRVLDPASTPVLTTVSAGPPDGSFLDVPTSTDGTYSFTVVDGPMSFFEPAPRAGWSVLGHLAPTPTTCNIDFQYCINSGGACNNGDKCCGGRSCMDKVCL